MFSLSPVSDAAALGRAHAVVRRGRDIADGADLEACGGQRADGGLTTGTRALDEDVDLAHAVLHGTTRGGLGSHLRGERGGLARALEADLAGGGPGNHGTRGVGDRDDRVVERALDVSVPVGNVLLLLAAHLLGASGTSLGRHYLPTFFLPATVRFGPLRVRALVLVR